MIPSRTYTLDEDGNLLVWLRDGYEDAPSQIISPAEGQTFTDADEAAAELIASGILLTPGATLVASKSWIRADTTDEVIVIYEDEMVTAGTITFVINGITQVAPFIANQGRVAIVTETIEDLLVTVQGNDRLKVEVKVISPDEEDYNDQ